MLISTSNPRNAALELFLGNPADIESGLPEVDFLEITARLLVLTSEEQRKGRRLAPKATSLCAVSEGILSCEVEPGWSPLELEVICKGSCVLNRTVNL